MKIRRTRAPETTMGAIPVPPPADPAPADLLGSRLDPALVALEQEVSAGAFVRPAPDAPPDHIVPVHQGISPGVGPVPTASDPLTCDRAGGRASLLSSPQAAPADSLPSGAANPSSYVDFLGELEAAFAEVVAVREAEQREQLGQALSDERAHWLARRFLELQEEEARVTAAYKSRIAAIRYNLSYLARRFEVSLAGWLARQLQGRRTKANHVKFDEGLIGFREPKPRPRVIDREAAARWAELHDDPAAPQFGRYGYVLDARKLIAHVEATGDAIPGIDSPPPERFLYVQNQLRAPNGKKVFRQIGISKFARGAPALPAPEIDDDHHEEEEENE